jgi:hypothetical protein
MVAEIIETQPEQLAPIGVVVHYEDLVRSVGHSRRVRSPECTKSKNESPACPRPE